MKMKNLIGLFVFLIFMASVSAMTMPHPIGGHVYLGNWKSDAIGVTIKNINTGEIVEVTTDGSGFYLFDVGNFKTSPYPKSEGHTLEITACQGDERCVQRIVINDAGGQTNIDFNIPSTATVTWNGIKIGVGVLVALAVAGLIGKAVIRKRPKLLVEILQSAQNVALGKLKQIETLERDEIDAAIEYEQSHRNRKRILNYLKSL